MAHNCIYTNGDGIVAGVDALTITDNEISGWNENGQHGIVIEEGVDPSTIDSLRISANRIHDLQGNAIVLNAPICTAIIEDNQLGDIGLSALLMTGSSRADHLVFACNQCLRVGNGATRDDLAYVAVQLINITRGNINHNTLGFVALNATAVPAVDAIYAVGVQKLAITGNRLFGIGPDRSAGQVTGIRLLAQFAHIGICDNEIMRRGTEDQKLAVSDWQAIRVHGVLANSIPSSGLAAAFVVAQTYYLITESRLHVLSNELPDLSIRGNQIIGEQVAMRVIECFDLSNLLFSENTCKSDTRGQDPYIALLEAETVTVVHNRLIGRFRDVMALAAVTPVKQAIVMGNTSTGYISVENGNPVPDSKFPTNIIGV